LTPEKAIIAEELPPVIIAPVITPTKPDKIDFSVPTRINKVASVTLPEELPQKKSHGSMFNSRNYITVGDVERQVSTSPEYLDPHGKDFNINTSIVKRLAAKPKKTDS